jgi:hypothetical protein
MLRQKRLLNGLKSITKSSSRRRAKIGKLDLSEAELTTASEFIGFPKSILSPKEKFTV